MKKKSRKKRKAKAGKIIRKRAVVKRVTNTALLQRKLTKGVKLITKELINTIKTEALPIVESEAINKVDKLKSTLEFIESTFEKRYTSGAEADYQEVLKTIMSATDRVFTRGGFSIPHDSQKTQDLVGALLEEYLSLIKKIPEDIIQGSRITLLHAVGGFDRHSIVEELNRISEASERRIKLIARDQTAKAVEAYNRARATDLGFTHYTWRTSQDERVSKGVGGHIQLDYRIYSYAEPTAFIDINKTKGHPGIRVNCRCHASPLLLREGEELRLVKDKMNGDYYEVITNK